MFPNAKIVLHAPGFRWNTVSVKRGTSLRGIICGPVRIVDCHVTEEGICKPCRREITGGKCPCYCDEKKNSIRTYGYLPIITKTGEEIVAILPKTTTHHCEHWGKGVPVEITAPDLEKSRKRIRQCPIDDFPTASVKQVKDMKEADIRPYLVYVLWKDDVLTKWFDANLPDGRPAKYPPLVRRRAPAPEPTQTPSDNAVSLGSFMDGVVKNASGQQ